MSLCSHCRTVTAPEDGEGTFYLTHPLPHTIGKLRKVFAEHYPLEAAAPGTLAVVLPAGSIHHVLDLLEKTLSTSERQACKVLQLAEGETFGLEHLSSVQPLDTFSAKARSGWLVTMIDQDAFYVDFQPIVSATVPTEVFAYECLLRGRDAEGKSVPPDRIFGTARGADLLFQVDRAARLTAIRSARAHNVTTPIFINFNPTSVYDPNFCLRTTVQAVQEAGITPERVVFEVVESDAVHDPEHLLTIVRFYRQQGFRIALDDLGAGYGSLNLLTSLQPDFVKFDRELSRAVDSDPYKQKVFGKLVEMARALGVYTLAEGIETEGEYRWLAAQGVDYLQGYFFARPASPPPLSTPDLTAQATAGGSILPARSENAADRQVPPAFNLNPGSDALQAVLDSLSEQVAVIDTSGTVLLVNRAWQQAGLEGGLSSGTRFTGVNYLDICRTAGLYGLNDGHRCYEGIRRVLDGSSASFSFEYRCDTPRKARWFVMNATPLTGGGAVILHMDITARKAQEATIHHLAYHDELTGAANRRYFYKEAQRTVTLAEQTMRPFSLLYLDLDDFKGINDRFGHACGDALLRYVSARLQGLSREGDLLTRFGGDEFVLLLKGVSSREVEGVAERYRAALAGPFVIEGRQLRGVGSLGAASYPEHGRTIDALLRRADAAMYREKAGHRKVVQVYQALLAQS